MQDKVKHRLQALIRNLAEEEDGAGPPYTAAAEPAVAAVESEASIGLSELVTDTSTSGETGNDSGATPTGAERADLRHLPAGLQRQAELEAKVVALLQERKQAAVRHERDLRQKEAEVGRLQQYIDNELQDLHHRQQQVEQRAPLVQVQLAEARNALRDLTISDGLYAQLQRVPEDQLTLVDAVKLAVHEHMQELKRDNERLRLSLASARETALRLEQENSMLQRENGRLAADLADNQGQVDGTVSSLQARCERLSAELEEAAVQVEVLNAKGQMYDDLQAKADRMADELERLHGAQASAQRLQQQLEDADSRGREREHTLELLLLDKAYLSKEVELLAERLAAADTQLKAKADKVAALKAAKAQLQAKLSEVEASGRQAADGKLSAELARLSAQAAADVDRVRREASEAYDRDTRMLRDLRDQAQAEAEAARAALKEARALQEEGAAAAREAAVRMDVRCAELAGELKLKAFEVQRLQVLADERAAALAEAQLQLGLQSDKVAVLTDNLYTVEAAGSRTASELRMQLEAVQAELESYRAADANVERTIVAAATELGSDPESADRRLLELLPAGHSSGLAATMQRRVQHNLTLAARCARLEAERGALAKEKEEVARQLQEARAQLVVAQQRLRHVGQPHGYLLEQLQGAEERARVAEADVKRLEETLHTKERDMREANEEKAALRRDLERILKERGALDSMRRLVLTALGSAQGGGQHGPVVPAAATAMLQAAGAPRAIIVDQRAGG